MAIIGADFSLSQGGLNLKRGHTLPHGMVNLSNDKLIDILLYGHESLSFELNTKILSATLDYIEVSKRFE